MKGQQRVALTGVQWVGRLPTEVGYVASLALSPEGEYLVWSAQFTPPRVGRTEVRAWSS